MPSAMRVEFRAINGQLPIDAYMRRLKVEAHEVLKEFAERVEKDYRSVSDQFKNPKHRPIYKVRVNTEKGRRPPSGIGGAAWFGSTLTRGSATRLPIMYWLDVGTHRYRKMSPDWVSLTRPGGGLRTQIPHGSPAAFRAGLPDIEPRGFTDDATDRNEEWFYTRITRAFMLAAASIQS